MRSWILRIPLSVIVVLSIGGCVYYNTFFNAKRAYSEAEKARLRQASTQTASTSSRQTTSTTSSRTTSPARTVASRTSGTSSRSTFAGTQDQLYRTAIEKSAKVIAYYPDSKYVDDALLLMAKSYFWLSEYARSLRKCDELLASYPDGEHSAEARYWRGMSLWKLGENDAAEAVLQRLVDEDRSRFRGNAAFALAELIRARGDLDRSVQLYQAAVDNASDEEFRMNAQRALGETLVEAGRPGEAVPVYRRLAERARLNQDRFEAHIATATTQRLVGDFDGALITLEPLLRDERFVDQLPRTRIEIARTHELAGELESAIYLYNELIGEEIEADAQKNPSSTQTQRTVSFTTEAQEAHYRLARIHENTFGDLTRAGALYDVASRGRGLMADSAKTRKQDIDSWTGFHTALTDTSDSTLTLRQSSILYSLGELFFFQLNDPDSSLYYFEMITTEHPKSIERPRALYAIGWILANVHGDTTAARDVWRDLLADTTQSILVDELQREVRTLIDGTDQVETDPAEERFQRVFAAWSETLENDPPDPPNDLVDSAAVAQWWDDWRNRHRERSVAYAPELDSIIAQHPESPYAARSRFILAWTAENVLEDTARAADQFRILRGDTLRAPAIAARADSMLALRLAMLAPAAVDSVSSDSTRAGTTTQPLESVDSPQTNTGASSVPNLAPEQRTPERRARRRDLNTPTE